jgi:hypothetical protein
MKINAKLVGEQPIFLVNGKRKKIWVLLQNTAAVSIRYATYAVAITVDSVYNKLVFLNTITYF